MRKWIDYGNTEKRIKIQECGQSYGDVKTKMHYRYLIATAKNQFNKIFFLYAKSPPAIATAASPAPMKIFGMREVMTPSA